MKRICDECGLEFEATNGRQRICQREHFRTCMICGKSFLVPRYRLLEKDCKTTCSKQCESELRKRSCLVKYGGSAPAVNVEVQQKICATNIERYGDPHPQRLDSCKAKAKQTWELKCKNDPEWTAKIAEKRKITNLQRYGTEWPVASEPIKNKIRSTMLRKYGNTCLFRDIQFRKHCEEIYFQKTGYQQPFANPDVQEKSQQTFKAKYGVNCPLQNASILQKAQTTTFAKYGVCNCMQNLAVKAKVARTNLKKYGKTCYLSSAEGKRKYHIAMQANYGVDYISQSLRWKVFTMHDPSKLENFMQFKSDPVKFIDSNFENSPTLMDLCNSVGVRTEAVNVILNKFNCKNKIAYTRSQMETEVTEAIKTICPDAIIEHNNRKLIHPYELDIYLPEYKLAIECNPASTHNSTRNTFCSTDAPTDSNYHKIKTDLCEQKGIFLLHIFGYEWWHSRNIMCSMLRNLLHKNTYRIFARNADLKEIDSLEANRFLQNCNLDGVISSDVQFGLFFADELVAIMTFQFSTTKNCWEIVQFCTKLNTSVVGGASKLLKYFISRYHPSKLMTTSARSHTTGEMFKLLGFQIESRSEPSYQWVDINSENVNATLKGDTSTSSRYVKVFDSGAINWLWSSTENQNRYNM